MPSFAIGPSKDLHVVTVRIFKVTATAAVPGVDLPFVMQITQETLPVKPYYLQWR